MAAVCLLEMSGRLSPSEHNRERATHCETDSIRSAKFIKRHKHLHHLLVLNPSAREELLTTCEGPRQSYLLRKANEKAKQFVQRNRKLSAAHQRARRQDSGKRGRTDRLRKHLAYNDELREHLIPKVADLYDPYVWLAQVDPDNQGELDKKLSRDWYPLDYWTGLEYSTVVEYGREISEEWNLLDDSWDGFRIDDWQDHRRWLREELERWCEDVMLITAHVGELDADGLLPVTFTNMGGDELAEVHADPASLALDMFQRVEADFGPGCRKYMRADARILPTPSFQSVNEWFEQ